MKELIGKADVLIEALPYIQKFRNSIMVVKFGGSAMEDPGLVESTMRDVVLLEAIGIRPIVVHGGGKAISAELRKQDIPVRFVNGLRYTCEKTIKIVDDVLHNQVNAALVRLGNENGGKMPDAIGIPEEMLRHAAEMAVCKINIDSDLRLAMTGTVRAFLDEHPDKFDPREYLKPARANIKELVRHKLVDVLGCAGKA